MSYSDLLRRPEWQKKRLEILSRDNWTCTCCLEDNKELQVHHIKYFGGKPWEIDNKFLVTLCVDCHEHEESLKNNDWYEIVRSTGLTRYSFLVITNAVSEYFKHIEHKDCYSVASFSVAINNAARSLELSAELEKAVSAELDRNG